MNDFLHSYALLARIVIASALQVSLLYLVGLSHGGLQVTWLSTSDIGTHSASPSVTLKSTSRLPRVKCVPYSINNIATQKVGATDTSRQQFIIASPNPR